MKIKYCSLAIAASLTITGPAFSLESGDWVARIGAGKISVNSSSGPLDTVGLGVLSGTEIGVDDKTGLAGSLGYMVNDRWGLELLIGAPFEHNVTPNSALAAIVGSNEDIASIKHLPPVFTANYHFNRIGPVHPYLGAGINYTHFFDEKAKGGIQALGYTRLELDDSWGAAFQAGADFDISERVFANFSVLWIDVDTEAKITGGAVGDITVKDIELDPLVFILSVGTAF